jgi:hypothetical protein
MKYEEYSSRNRNKFGLLSWEKWVSKNYNGPKREIGDNDSKKNDFLKREEE